jgi:hypothetical protein
VTFIGYSSCWGLFVWSIGRWMDRLLIVVAVRAWLPVCHTCSSIRGVIGCCGWRARSQACIIHTYSCMHDPLPSIPS